MFLFISYYETCSLELFHLNTPGSGNSKHNFNTRIICCDGLIQNQVVRYRIFVVKESMAYKMIEAHGCPAYVTLNVRRFGGDSYFRKNITTSFFSSFFICLFESSSYSLTECYLLLDTSTISISHRLREIIPNPNH